MRTSDRQRARDRRDRQLGETEEMFQNRNRIALEQLTGLTVRIHHDPRGPHGMYEVTGYRSPEQEASPIIRVTHASFKAAARVFQECADKLAAGAAFVRAASEDPRILHLDDEDRDP